MLVLEREKTDSEEQRLAKAGKCFRYACTFSIMYTLSGVNFYFVELLVKLLVTFTRKT